MMPSVLKPPIVMMQYKRDPAKVTNEAQLACHLKIAAQTEIVRPDHPPLASTFLDQIKNGGAQSLGIILRPGHFGNITELWPHKDTHWNTLQPLPETRQPQWIGLFSARQQDPIKQSVRKCDQVRRRKVDNSSHPAGSEMVMEDNQQHELRIARSVFGGQLFLWLFGSQSVRAGGVAACRS
jgi:hypothetical protein